MSAQSLFKSKPPSSVSTTEVAAGLSRFCDQKCIPAPEKGGLIIRNCGDLLATFSQCSGCGYRTFDPLPTNDMLNNLYANEYWSMEVARAQAIKSYSEVERREGPDFYARIVEIFTTNRISKNMIRIHEVGCGFGSMVKRFNDSGAKATGTDLSSLSIQIGRELGNSEIHALSSEEYLVSCGEKMDVIFMQHSLEHMLDPIEVLNGLTPHLADDGFLFILVPNGLYVRAIVDSFASWHWCSYPQHLHYFTPKSFNCLFRKTGLRMIDVISGMNEEWKDEFARSMFGRSKEQIVDWNSIGQALANNIMGCEIQVIATKISSPLKQTQRSLDTLKALGNEKLETGCSNGISSEGRTAEILALTRKVDQITNSLSWRVTAPLRVLNLFAATIKRRFLT